MTDETITELRTWIEYCKLMAALEEEKTASNVGAQIRQETIAETFRRIADGMSAKIRNTKRRQRKVKQLANDQEKQYTNSNKTI